MVGGLCQCQHLACQSRETKVAAIWQALGEDLRKLLHEGTVQFQSPQDIPNEIKTLSEASGILCWTDWNFMDDAIRRERPLTTPLPPRRRFLKRVSSQMHIYATPAALAVARTDNYGYHD